MLIIIKLFFKKNIYIHTYDIKVFKSDIVIHKKKAIKFITVLLFNILKFWFSVCHGPPRYSTTMVLEQIDSPQNLQQ